MEGPDPFDDPSLQVSSFVADDEEQNEEAIEIAKESKEESEFVHDETQDKTSGKKEKGVTKKRGWDLLGMKDKSPAKKKLKMGLYYTPNVYFDMTEKPGQMELDEILNLHFPFDEISPNDVALLSKIGGEKVINNVISVMEIIDIKDDKGNDIRSNKLYNILKKTQTFFGIYNEMASAYNQRQQDCFEFSTGMRWVSALYARVVFPVELKYLRWLENLYTQLVGWTQTNLELK